MDVNEIKSQIKNKKLNHFYIFTGDEWKVQQIYIQQIAKVSKLKITYIDTITDVWSQINNKGFMKNPMCYVVRDDDVILQNDKVQMRLNTIKSDIVILLLSNIDKRTKFYKIYKNKIVEFNSLNPDILKKYIQKEVDLTDKNYKLLMDICDYNYGRCLLEVDKIKQYIAEKSNDHSFEDDTFNKFINDGTINIPPGDVIFDFINAILDANCELAFELYDECLDYGNSIIAMLSILHNAAKQTLQVQSYNGNDIERATGLTGWQVKKAREHCNVYSNRELIGLMRLCCKCEHGIKMGKLDEQDAMRYILSTIEW